MTSRPSDSRRNGPAIETGYAPVDGTRLFYRTAGDGPPLVFVHAGVTDSRLWERQLATFADSFRVVAYDLRGFGDSELPAGPYAHYRDLGALLDALGIDSAHLVGASMGGAAALDFALDRSNRVRTLTLVAPAVGGYEFVDETTLVGWEAAEAAFDTGDFERAAAIETEMWLVGPRRRPEDVDDEARELVRSMLRGSYERVTDDAIAEELRPPALGRLGELSVPTLLVSGELDTPDMAAIAGVLEREVRDVRSEVVEGVAHLPSLERPAAFDAALRSFLEDASTAPPSI